MGRTAHRLRVPLWIGLVVFAACAVFGLGAAVAADSVAWTWWGAALLFVTIVSSEAGSVEVSQATDDEDGGRYIVSVATIPHIVSILLLPPPLAALLAGGGMFIDELRNRSRPDRLAFNVAVTTLSVGTAGLAAVRFCIQGPALADEDWRRVAAFFGVIAVYYVVNALPVVVITALARGGSFGRLLVTTARQSAPAELAVAVVGGLAAHEWAHGPAWVIAGLSPALISQLAFRSIGARNRKTQQIASLDRLGRSLSSVFNVESVFDIAGKNLRSVAPVAGCFLELSDPPLHLSDGDAVGRGRRPLLVELTQRAVRSGGPVWHTEATGGASRSGGEVHTWLVLPLKLGDAAGGAFGIQFEPRKAFDSGDRAYYELIAERITIAFENARRAEELTRMAFQDALTGLANRALLLDRLEHALVRSTRYHRPVAVLFIDLDNFKLVNDSLGHDVGDRLLQQVAERLQASTRAEDTLARLGGDEFVMLLEEIQDTQQAYAAADRLATALARPIEVGGRSIVVEASFGIAVSGPGRERPADLLRDADVALYRAKTAGKGRRVLFEPGFEAAAIQRLDLENDLRRAVAQREFVLFYQPIMSLQTGRLAGWEALVRWQHPTRGLVPPNEFIPVAEETGVIVPLGQWVLEEACRQCVAWQSGRGGLVMSVNLSGRQFQQPTLVEDVRRALEMAGLRPSLLKLEITESVVMQDAAAACNVLSELADLGIGVAIDDFGTGYSSLSYLKQFPIETLKIDRSFVTGIVTDAQDMAIVRSIVALAKSLNLTVTAEGIETPSQQARLTELGCELGQGYLFGRPAPAEAAFARAA